MKKLWQRFTGRTPNWTTIVQSALLTFSGYNELVVLYPDLLNIISPELQHKAAGYSALAAVALQMINKKKVTEENWPKK